MRGTVLVVDDDLGVRDATRLVLSREGYDVLMAPDGRTAIELMSSQENSYKVCTVLCDLEMPNVGGKELIAHFRAHYPTIPIIVFSGASDTQFLEGILQQGVCDWMRKPVTRDILVQKVRTAANLFALRKQQGA
jgi:DNA-binding NtrC family response regulator